MIIGLSGYAQVGKDTVAQYLIDNYGYKRVAFADPLRKSLYNLNPTITDLPEVPEVHLAYAVDSIGWELVKQSSSQVRGLLQRMGTEVGRNLFGEDFWVNQAMQGISKFDKVVFTDVRFPNEYRSIKLREGMMLRITKPGINAVNGHISETALDNYNFDGILDNSGSKEELYAKIDSLMKDK